MPKREPTAVELIVRAYINEQRPCPSDMMDDWVDTTAPFMLAALRELQRQLEGRLGARLASSYIGAVIDEHERSAEENE